MSEFIVRTYQQVAEFFGIAEGTIKTKWTPAGMPGERPRGKRTGRYDLSEIAQWYRVAYRADSDGGGGISGAMQKAKLAEQIAKARERKVRADTAENLSISRDAHEQELVRFGQMVLKKAAAQAAKIRGAKARRDFQKYWAAIRQAVVDELQR